MVWNLELSKVGVGFGLRGGIGARVGTEERRGMAEAVVKYVCTFVPKFIFWIPSGTD